MKIKSIDVTVGIYDTEATITRHRNGTVSIRAPYIKWVDNTGHLAFERIYLSGDTANLADRVFSDAPPISYGEFVADYL